MKNVHLLPTDKPSRLHLIEDVLTFTNKYKTSVCDSEVNIYITSDEEIKDVRPHKGKWQLEQEQILNKFPTYLTDLSECKLVIMTTDPDLIKDGVQPIDNEFLEWFVKNPSCEEVEVEKLKCTGQCWKFIESDYKKTCLSGCEQIEYKIIIPQEEPKQGINIEEFEKKANLIIENVGKQETLEEAGKFAEIRYLERLDNFQKCDFKDGVIEGANWQAERMYSEEEVKEILMKTDRFLRADLDLWFEQIRKK
jgi:hypothetical protein